MEEKIKNLKHTKVKIEGGGEVYILDKGEIINPEAEAMLQALHSRSSLGLKSHLEILQKKGADNFMSKFYIGYGHKSIGDCGSITLFIEGVSMLAAKAIQDFKLYSGQEASTRYIDFSKQNFISPIKEDKWLKLLEKQRKFYLESLPLVVSHFKEMFPISKEENEKIYDKAILAKSFDVVRGFLPCGASTNLAWHSNLRQIADRLLFLRHHPLEEVRNICDAIEKAVLLRFPNSFSKKRYENTEKYQDLIAENYYYHNPKIKDFEYDLKGIDFELLKKSKKLFSERGEKTELPFYLNEIGYMNFSFKLDFASFRDLQRHRAINQRMPLVSTELGFNEFYLNSLPIKLKEKAKKHLKEIEEEVKELSSKEIKQYYIPMGYNTSNSFNGTIPYIVYMVELRATRFVHPTLRKVAKKIGDVLENKCEIKLNLDLEPDRFDIKRGEQDIVLK